MCASATAILHWNAIQVFADIDPVTYCLDPASVRKSITDKTKAILSVDNGGHPADTFTLNKIAKEYGQRLYLIVSNPGALSSGKYAGTLTDIGGYSLNYHKHIHTGEGGILVTNDDELALRMQLIRNHAEASVADISLDNIANMIGHNFRLGEIECAIGREQLKKLPKLVEGPKIAKKIIKVLSHLKGLQLPVTLDSCTHSYYMFFMQVDSDVTGVHRDIIYEALEAEGVPGISKSFANLHLLPLYQKKIAYGSSGFPWTSPYARQNISYQKGICPVAENLHDRSYIGFQMCMFQMSDQEITSFINAFQKVWDNLDALKEYAQK